MELVWILCVGKWVPGPRGASALLLHHPPSCRKMKYRSEKTELDCARFLAILLNLLGWGILLMKREKKNVMTTGSLALYCSNISLLSLVGFIAFNYILAQMPFLKHSLGLAQ